MSDAPPSVRLESGECLTLSPNSERYRAAYQQVQPRRAEDVRATLGLSADATKALQASGMCCQPGPAMSPLPEDLTHDDADTRGAARRATYTGLQAYVRSAAPNAYANLVPAFNRYLDLTKAVINIITLSDIEVADGATLTISASTHVVNARKVIIHGTGRIACKGSTTFKIVSLEGTRRFSPLGVAEASVVGRALHP
jgi:hypothetical protein